MRVAEVMQEKVVGVLRDAPIADAVALMADSHVSGLPVVDDHGTLVGAISSSDILLAEAELTTPEAHETLFHNTRVREVMTPKPLTISPEADLKDAARQMLYADVHRLFVTIDETVVGVVSRSDIARIWATARR